jgi:hypothetical protein
MKPFVASAEIVEMASTCRWGEPSADQEQSSTIDFDPNRKGPKAPLCDFGHFLARGSFVV